MSEETEAKSIAWYRSPVDREEMRKLYVRSDILGMVQAGGYLLLLCTTGTLAFYSCYHWHWWITALLVFIHGTCCAFFINAVHETGHNTVFKTRELNVAFVHIFAFFGMINHRMFETSHLRHHRSTLHPPDDLEVVVPIKKTFKDFLKYGFINFDSPKYLVRLHLRVARGKFEGEWENKLFPESNPERRKWASNWSKTVLIGHGAILITAIAFKLWMIPIIVTFVPCYGGWLQLLCNETQHIGLQDNVTDYRLNTRTVLLNPLLRFLYWHMNYHIEHHMFVGVPCYNLSRLHELIKEDLPPATNGLLATWIEISAILKKQAADPHYQHIALQAESTG